MLEKLTLLFIEFVFLITFQPLTHGHPVNRNYYGGTGSGWFITSHKFILYSLISIDIFFLDLYFNSFIQIARWRLPAAAALLGGPTLECL